MALRFSRLDRPAIRRLRPGERITEHGIIAEQLANGDLRYSVNVMVDGLRIHRVIGKASDGVPAPKPKSSSNMLGRMRAPTDYRYRNAANFISRLPLPPMFASRS